MLLRFRPRFVLNPTVQQEDALTFPIAGYNDPWFAEKVAQEIRNLPKGASADAIAISQAILHGFAMVADTLPHTNTLTKELSSFGENIADAIRETSKAET